MRKTCKKITRDTTRLIITSLKKQRYATRLPFICHHRWKKSGRKTRSLFAWGAVQPRRRENHLGSIAAEDTEARRHCRRDSFWRVHSKQSAAKGTGGAASVRNRTEPSHVHTHTRVRTCVHVCARASGPAWPPLCRIHLLLRSVALSRSLGFIHRVASHRGVTRRRGHSSRDKKPSGKRAGSSMYPPEAYKCNASESDRRVIRERCLNYVRSLASGGEQWPLLR